MNKRVLLLLIVASATALLTLVWQSDRPAGVADPLAGLSAAERAQVDKARSFKFPSSWFMRQRLSGDPVPPGVLGRELKSFRVRRGASGGGGNAAAAGMAPGAWVSAGPLNVGGRVTALALDPNDVMHVWLGTAAGGVWSTSDGGTTWARAWPDDIAQPIGAMAAHPTDPDIVWVGTGEDNGGGYSYDGDGVYKTIDGGQTWQHIGLPDSRRIGALAVDPLNPDRVFVAVGGNVFAADVHRGIYRSTDGGTNWTKVLFVDDETGGTQVAIDPGNPNRVYAAMWHRMSSDTDISFGGDSGGVWISDDGGDTWTKQTTSGLPTTNVGRIGLAIAPSDTDTVYARYQTASGSFKGLWKTTDSAGTWSRVDQSGIWRFFMASWGYYFGQVRVDPANADNVFLLDIQWHESSNGGQDFTARGGLHVDHHDMILEPGRWYMGNDGGFYWSTNDGSSWEHAETLPISQSYDIAITELDTARRFMGLQDNGTVRTTTAGLSDWQNVLGGDGLQCEVDPTDPMLVYASSQGGNINRSTDGGDTFSTGTNGIGNERTNWNAPLTHDPVTSQKLYTGTYRVYRTVDGAQNWSPISSNLTNGPSLSGAPTSEGGRLDGQSHLEDIVRGTVTTIGVSPVDTSILWAGTDDGNVWVSTDEGAGWTQVNVPGRTEWVTRVTADPFQSNTAYVTFSGFRSDDRMPHVFRTLDLGQSWQDIAGNLPVVPINDVVGDPTWEGRLYVGTDLGTFVTDSWGAEWDEMNGGMPLSVIHDLQLDDGTRTLYAGTHAQSLWTFDVEQLGIPDRDLDGVDNLADCAPDDGGVFAAPLEVTGLRFVDVDTLEWDSAQPSAGNDTVHDLVRGELAQLPVGSGGAETCVAPGTSASSADDMTVPAIGTAFWYLVRGTNVCGVGTYGNETGGAERLTGACP